MSILSDMAMDDLARYFSINERTVSILEFTNTDAQAWITHNLYRVYFEISPIGTSGAFISTRTIASVPQGTLLSAGATKFYRSHSEHGFLAQAAHFIAQGDPPAGGVQVTITELILNVSLLREEMDRGKAAKRVAQHLGRNKRPTIVRPPTPPLRPSLFSP